MLEQDPSEKYTNLLADALISFGEDGLNTDSHQRGIGPRNAALCKRREELGLKQRDLGELVGYSAQAVSHWETLRYYPHPEQVQKISEVLGINPFPEWLQPFAISVRNAIPIEEVELTETSVGWLSWRFEVGDPVPEAERRDLKDQIDKQISRLPYQQKQVLKLRFGFEDGIFRTQEEVGRKLGVTGHRIRQIESQALRTLRHPSRSKYLKDFFDRKSEYNQRGALMNGVINALHQGDNQRALDNLAVIEKSILSRFPKSLRGYLSLMSECTESHHWSDEEVTCYLEPETNDFWIGSALNALLYLRIVWQFRAKAQSS